MFVPAGGGVEAGGSWRAAYWTVGEREHAELFFRGDLQQNLLKITSKNNNKIAN